MFKQSTLLFFSILYFFPLPVFGQIDCSIANTLQCGNPWSLLINAGSGNDNVSYCGFQNEGNETYYAFQPAVAGNYFISVDEFGGTSTPYEMRYGECFGTNWNCLGIYSGSSSTDFIYLTTKAIYVFSVDLQSCALHRFQDLLPKTTIEIRLKQFQKQLELLYSRTLRTCNALFLQIKPFSAFAYMIWMEGRLRMFLSMETFCMN